MVRRLAIAVGLALGAGLVLAGCSSGNVASGVTEQELAGQWVAEAPFLTKLVLAEDGTLTATAWPQALGCTGGPVVDVNDLAGSPVTDVRGTWSSDGGSISYQLSLRFELETCPEGGAFAYVWRNGDNSLDMCIRIPLDVSFDDVTRDELFVLHGEAPGDANRGGTCL